MDTRNVVVLSGRLVADPELRYMPNGKPVASFAIAVEQMPQGARSPGAGQEVNPR